MENPLKVFLDRGGTIVWGIVPTNFEPFEKETLDTLKKTFNGYLEFCVKIWN